MFGVASGWIDTAMNLSGNLTLVGTGHLTDNNLGCLGYSIVVDGHIVTSRGVSAPLSGTVNPEGYSYGRMGNRLTNNDQLIISLQPNGRVITRLFQLRHEK